MTRQEQQTLTDIRDRLPTVYGPVLTVEELRGLRPTRRSALGCIVHDADYRRIAGQMKREHTHAYG